MVTLEISNIFALSSVRMGIFITSSSAKCCIFGGNVLVLTATAQHAVPRHGALVGMQLETVGVVCV